ncbi:MAG: flavodoxin family protein [Lachnospiraceae bacterium]|nr:flavodoxin family protein [Lachnospiraceae bacterium]
MYKVAMFVSSITGNTKKIADRLEEELIKAGNQVDRFQTIKAVKDLPKDQYDMKVVLFWCRRSVMDDASMMLMDLYHDDDFIVIGTMGNYPDSAYGDLVKENVIEVVERQNHCVDIFLSQGKIRPERTEARRKLDPSAPHYLDDEGYKRHLESRKHPNEEDIQGAIRCVMSHLPEVA